MSSNAVPVQILWAIREDPQNEASLFAMVVNDHELAVCLFTQLEHADAFASKCSEIPVGAAVAVVEVSALRTVLAQQVQQGRTHVVTDPILSSGGYLDASSLAISEYLNRLS